MGRHPGEGGPIGDAPAGPAYGPDVLRIGPFLMTFSWMTTLRSWLAPLRRLALAGLALLLMTNLAACSGIISSDAKDAARTVVQVAKTAADVTGNEQLKNVLTPVLNVLNTTEKEVKADNIPAATTVGDDGEAASGADAAAGTAQENSPAAQPNVRQEADDRGRVKNQQSKPNALQKFFNFLGGKKEKTDGGNRQQKPPPQNHR